MSSYQDFLERDLEPEPNEDAQWEADTRKWEENRDDEIE